MKGIWTKLLPCTQKSHFTHLDACAGSRVVRIDPHCFLIRCHKRRRNQVLSVLYLYMFVSMFLFIRAPFYVSLICVGMCSVIWLFWLSCQYLPSDWLKRLLCRSLVVARGSSPQFKKLRPKRVYDFLGLLYCFIVWLCACLVPRPFKISFVLLWHDIACLCWKCR